MRFTGCFSCGKLSVANVILNTRTFINDFFDCSSEIDLVLHRPKATLDDFTPSGEWDILSIPGSNIRSTGQQHLIYRLLSILIWVNVCKDYDNVSNSIRHHNSLSQYTYEVRMLCTSNFDIYHHIQNKGVTNVPFV